MVTAVLGKAPNDEKAIESKKPRIPGHCPGTSGTVADYGCHNNKCWAYCGLVGNWRSGQWCYTQSHSNLAYVECRNDEECCPTWSCGGACSL